MPTPPYDLVNTIANAARTRLNDKVDTLVPIGGRILNNSQAFGQQVINDAWRKLQEKLADEGYSGLEQEVIFPGVPGCTSTDPVVQVSISYSGYFDGTNPQAAPALPQGMVRPYSLWERPSGSTNSLTEMDPQLNGLPSVPKMPWNRQWEWRDDVLYMPGATGNTDIRLRYAAFFPDFADVGATPWFEATVPIMRCQDSFADYICREFMIARGDSDGAASFQASAEANAMLIIGRDTKQGKAIFKYSEFQKMADRFTPNSGPNTQPVRRGA